MQVGVEDLAVAQHLALAGLRFLHLDDHVGAGEHLFGGIDDLGTGGDVGVVARVDAGTGVGLDNDLVAVAAHLDDALRRQADAVFVILDLFWGSDEHGVLLRLKMAHHNPGEVQFFTYLAQKIMFN